MRIHYLQHVWFEDLGMIQEWAKGQGSVITRTAFCENEILPDINSIDWLVVLGGPMGVYDEGKYPWLIEEKIFIKEAIRQGKIVLGICLGAQLIADVLDAKVEKNEFKEIGWFPIQLTHEEPLPIFESIPSECAVFHWHGDKFHIPHGAVRVAQSKGCSNQAFSYDHGRVVGFQFHMELTQSGVERLAEQCKEELTEGKYIQPKEELLRYPDLIQENNSRMHGLLDKMKDAGQR